MAIQRRRSAQSYPEPIQADSLKMELLSLHKELLYAGLVAVNNHFRFHLDLI